MRTTVYGEAPTDGWSPFVPELLVESLDGSLRFWSDVLRFRRAYGRPEERFVYLEHASGAQLMLAERAAQRGKNETAPLERPFGRGVMFQLVVDDLEPVLEAIAREGIAVRDGPRETWRRTGEREGGRREVRLLDPDGYHVMVAEEIGVRSPAFGRP